MSKRNLEKDQLFKILIDDNQGNSGDMFEHECCDRDELSDSEEEHISEASEDDNDELSCESDIDDVPLKNCHRKRKFPISGQNVQAKKRKVLNNRRNMHLAAVKKTVLNPKIRVVK